ncbi:DUF3224 domain-containing protein [Pseudoduganella sp. LjRoot289]|uniref:DUF3224 domain-containing protein n=1 Tax=Pseudoduganella sp. LjRoot289 TaxID=3342314 RepID=UPI003ECF9A6E
MPAQAQTGPEAGPAIGPEAGRVGGKFEITVAPAAPPIHEGRTAVARMLLYKQYFGDLQATGKGEMLTARTDTKGSAAYVAIERITGTLAGRKGSFVVQHAGSMRGGASDLKVGIVPDSGSGELAGISGQMSLKQVERQHYYEMDYVLPAPPR